MSDWEDMMPDPLAAAHKRWQARMLLAIASDEMTWEHFVSVMHEMQRGLDVVRPRATDQVITEEIERGLVDLLDAARPPLTGFAAAYLLFMERMVGGH